MDNPSIEENGKVKNDIIEKPKKKKQLSEKQKEALEKGRIKRQENLNRLSKIIKKEKIKKLQEEIGEEEPQTPKPTPKAKPKPKPKKKVVYTYESETDNDDDDNDDDSESGTPPQQPAKINKPKRKVNTPPPKQPKLTRQNATYNEETPKQYTPSFFFV